MFLETEKVPDYKCPGCGGLMEKGDMGVGGGYGLSRITWTEEWSNQEGTHSFVLKGLLNQGKTRAWLCRECKLVLFESQVIKENRVTPEGSKIALWLIVGLVVTVLLLLVAIRICQ